MTGYNGTIWSDESEEHDLKFLGLRCGNEYVDYQWIDSEDDNGIVFIENYECNEKLVMKLVRYLLLVSIL
jgi:hypothetical protein